MVDVKLKNIRPAAAAGEKSELRFAPRRTCKIPAFLHIESVVQGIPCFITNVSTTGLRIALKAGWDAPIKHYTDTAGRVRLVERVEKVSYDCKIVHREETALGLKFLAPPTLHHQAKR